MIERIKKINGAVEKFTTGVAWISYICIVAMMLMNTVDVIMSLVANKNIIGAYEISQRLLMCAVFCCFAYAQSKKQHICMTLVVKHYPRVIRFFCFSLMSLLSVVVSAATTWAAWVQMNDYIARNFTTEVLYIPLWPFYLVEVIGMAIFTLTVLYDTVLYAISMFSDETAELVQSEWTE